MKTDLRTRSPEEAACRETKVEQKYIIQLAANYVLAFFQLLLHYEGSIMNKLRACHKGVVYK